MLWESTYEDTQSYSDDDDDDDDDEKYVQLPPPCVVAQLASISRSTTAVSGVKPCCTNQGHLSPSVSKYGLQVQETLPPRSNFS